MYYRVSRARYSVNEAYNSLESLATMMETCGHGDRLQRYSKSIRQITKDLSIVSLKIFKLQSEMAPSWKEKTPKPPKNKVAKYE